MIRIVEDKDWIIAILLGAIILYIISSRLLHKNLSLWEYLHLQYFENNNAMLSWVLVSISYVVLSGALISQSIPIVPKPIVQFCAGFNFIPNKFVFFIATVFLYQFGRSVFTFLFFMSTGNLKRWHRFYFIQHKFYVVINIIIVLLILFFHFVPHPNLQNVLFFSVIYGSIFALKLIYMLIHQQLVLPSEWYYKFLYLCTLQIIPTIVLVKILYIIDL